MSEESTPSVTAPARAVAAVDRFVAAHGEAASAVVEGVSCDKVRITLVGADGNLGDVIVRDAATAAAVVEASTATGAEWDRELSGSVTLTRANRARMAGGRAR
ncbi:hypothetical protein RHODO2019_07120 [Rhodococcus antarcticus]|jgi:hypothetical protein|uniref:YbaB/EbfC DNA-binding family protein n=1 Tax=Rhodococcus antarcticus TaxID=2987751 RepID=A0ABY6P3E4_9NOCA|nr:hypothetical protein [Rhodococcus antarcticus]UZJ26175.1 hypothetical protein RHODO2019_07120 [Rhodococcus antarcticus]